jgi:serine O-acetyltransferase
VTDHTSRDDAPYAAFPEEIDRVVDGLRQARLDWRAATPRHHEGGSSFPSRQALKRITRELGTALFPLRLGPSELTAGNENAFIAASLESTLSQLSAQVGLELSYSAAADARHDLAERTSRIMGYFAGGLPAIRRSLDSDVAAAYAADPAARSVDEVLVAYTSFTAILHHRIAHHLYALGAPLVARLIAEIAHGRTASTSIRPRGSGAASSSIMVPGR